MGREQNKKQRKKRNKEKRRKSIVYTIGMILCACVFVGCAVYLLKYFLESKKSEDKFDELRAMISEDDDNTSETVTATDGDAGPTLEYVEVDGVMVQKKFEELYRMNHDFIGWISIEGMVIDYPVMQTMNDEEFYIYRDFDKEYSRAGTPFIDTSSNVEAPSDNILIYGHYMKTGMMFHDLENYEDEDFYKEHKYIQFDTIYGNGTYEVIAAFRSKIYPADYTGFKYYQFFDAANEEEFNDYVRNCMALTNYTIAAEVSYGDTLITLSTCAYHEKDGRFAVVAKKID